ncbi:MAG TPA: 2-C-methyl-D-erythritol 4-phosphate cytidylyltransferase [Gammaproteobacteria bacterium]|nr:2-C-methyl-D-erythritol 4-phosphate cytidylyltransferase [Gammaproteobacteria bacterium]
MTESSRHWALVPAAGLGRRMGGGPPKQWLELGGRSVLAHSLEALGALPGLAGLVLVTAPAPEPDPRVERLLQRFCACPAWRVDGGSERCHSVLNGLDALAGRAQAQDWVLVHDAARPCLRSEDLERLVLELAGDAVGGLLAVPVRDTMKRAGEDGRVRETVPRERLWHAQTPQMFRFEVLHRALRAALAEGFEVTDEASAVEHAGLAPRLVEGHADNIKITRPEDLALAERYLQAQGRM